MCSLGGSVRWGAVSTASVRLEHLRRDDCFAHSRRNIHYPRYVSQSVELGLLSLSFSHYACMHSLALTDSRLTFSVRPTSAELSIVGLEI